MHIRWNRRQLLSNRQTGEALCSHVQVVRPVTWAPVLIHQKKPLWYLAPCIRECCIENKSPLPIAAWWWEVQKRFEDLKTHSPLDAEITKALLEQQDYIEGILEEVVPIASPVAMATYEEYRLKQGVQKRRLKGRQPPDFKLLGLDWPCTQNELKERWKVILKLHHPDRGGDTREFIRLKDIYETVSESLKSA